MTLPGVNLNTRGAKRPPGHALAGIALQSPSGLLRDFCAKKGVSRHQDPGGNLLMGGPFVRLRCGQGPRMTNLPWMFGRTLWEWL
jgi:hypothetical protein